MPAAAVVGIASLPIIINSYVQPMARTPPRCSHATPTLSLSHFPHRPSRRLALQIDELWVDTQQLLPNGTKLTCMRVHTQLLGGYTFSLPLPIPSIPSFGWR